MEEHKRIYRQTAITQIIFAPAVLLFLMISTKT